MSVLYAINTVGGSIAANTTIPLTITRRKCPIYTLSGSGIQIEKAGYYRVSGSITFTVPTAGDVELTLLRDATPIAGATSSLTAAVTTTYTLPIDAVIRVLCHEGEPTIYLLNSGVAITLINASLVIEDV